MIRDLSTVFAQENMILNLYAPRKGVRFKFLCNGKCKFDASTAMWKVGGTCPDLKLYNALLDPAATEADPSRTTYTLYVHHENFLPNFKGFKPVLHIARVNVWGINDPTIGHCVEFTNFQF